MVALNLNSKQLCSTRTSVEEVTKLILHNPPGGWPDSAHTWPNVQEAYRDISASVKEEILGYQYPSDMFSGRGIVFCGGGSKYFPSLYVNINILRLTGCTLPVEVWYIGEGELDWEMRKLLEDIDGVKCIDAENFSTDYRARILGGWQCKVFSMVHCAFDEVLLLDADNTPLIDPTFLFDEPQYIDKGAILWPDAQNWKPHDAYLWNNIFGLERIEEKQIESGQVLVDKRKCWNQLHMAKYYCDYSEYYFKHVYGDKEAFHFGWRYIHKEYAQPPYPGWIVCDGGNGKGLFSQKDLSGANLFSHRVQCKFKYDKTHPIATGWVHEKESLELLDELQTKWNGAIWCQEATEDEKELCKEVGGKLYLYSRFGLGSRDLQLEHDGSISVGNDRMEKHWRLFKKDEDVFLVIHGISEPTCILKYNNGCFSGKWIKFERCITTLTPYVI